MMCLPKRHQATKTATETNIKEIKGASATPQVPAQKARIKDNTATNTNIITKLVSGGTPKLSAMPNNPQVWRISAALSNLGRPSVIMPK